MGRAQDPKERSLMYLTLKPNCCLEINRSITYISPGQRFMFQLNGLHTGWPGVDVMITIFYDYCQISAKTIGVFLKNQWYDHFLHKLTVVWAKNANNFAIFFAKIFKKIITLVRDDFVVKNFPVASCIKLPKLYPSHIVLNLIHNWGKVAQQNGLHVQFQNKSLDWKIAQMDTVRPFWSPWRSSCNGQFETFLFSNYTPETLTRDYFLSQLGVATQLRKCNYFVIIYAGNFFVASLRVSQPHLWRCT
jgi:hypothetical protein